MDLSSSYSGGPGAWHATIKDDGRVIWTCPHVHRNRDQSSYSRGQAARACGSAVLALVKDPAYADVLDRWWNSSSRMARWGDSAHMAEHREAKRLAAEVRTQIEVAA